MPTKTKGKRGGRHGGGYAGYRDQATQMTPRQMVDDRRARLLGLEIMERQKQLVARSEVEAGERECAAVIQSDLFGALPSRLATVLGGRKLDAEAVRQAALGIVSEIVGGWTDAGIVKQEAKHAGGTRPATWG